MKKNFMKTPTLYAVVFASLLMAGCNNSSDNAKIETEVTDTSETDEIKDDDINMENTAKITKDSINLDDYSNDIEINNPGTYEVTGTLNDYMIYVNTDGKVTLNFNNVEISNTNGPCIYVKKSENVSINLEGNNILTNNENKIYETLDAAIYSKSDLVIDGEGNLSIEAQYNHGIKGKDNILINNGNITIKSIKDCINCNDDLTLNNGILELYSEEDECLQSESNLYINGGTINIDSNNDGIKAESIVEINDGNIKITNASEGIESKDTLTINGGTIDILSSDDCINATNKIVINSGNIKAISTGNDAIDSNRTIEINDGDIYALALSQAEGAFDCDSNSFIVNGGNLFGIGTTHSQPTDGKQNTLIINPEISNNIENITIKDSNENIVYELGVDDYSIYAFGTNKDGNLMNNDFDNMGDKVEGNKPNKMPDETVTDMPADVPVDSSVNTPTDVPNPQENMPKNEFANNKNNFNKKGVSSSLILFISNENLKTGETYIIYINGEELETIKIENCTTTIGNVQTMGGGMKNFGNR